MRRREECFTTSQSGHLLYHYKANNGQAGVGFLINKKWKDHTVRVNSFRPKVAEIIMCVTKHNKLKTMHVYAPITSYSEEDINTFYNDIDETLGKPKNCMIVMGYLNAQIGTRTNSMETVMGKCGPEELEIKRGGRISNIKKVQNREYHGPEESTEEMGIEKPSHM